MYISEIIWFFSWILLIFGSLKLSVWVVKKYEERKNEED